MNSTIYDVKLRYTMDNRAGNSVRGLTKDVNGLGDASGKVTGLLGKLATGVIAAFGAREAGKALVGFNSTVEDTKLQIAGMLAITKKTDLSDQVGKADKLYANLSARAAKLPGTTAEYTQMLGMLTQPLTDAGANLKQLEDLTVNSTVAAKSLGVEWEAAARDIDQALQGQFHSVDRFTGKVLGSVGYKGEEGRQKYNALDANQRMQVLNDALMQKQWAQLAEAQGKTFSGQLSTLTDNAEKFMGKVGAKLFALLKQQIGGWNEWYDKNSAKVDALASRFAEGLADGFGVVKTAVGFIVDHAELLLTIGKVWAAVRIGGMLGGGIAGGAGGAGGKIASLIAWGSGIKDKFDEEGKYQYTPAGAGRQNVTAGNIGGALPMLGQSLAAGYAIGSVINEQTGASSQIADSLAHLTGRVDATTDRFDQLQRSSKQLDDAMSHRRGAGAGGFSGTVFNSNLLGMVDKYKADINAHDDFLRTVNAKGIGSDEGRAAFAAYQARGVNGKDIASERAALPRLLETQTQVMSSALGGYLAGINKLNATQIKSLDVQQAQEQIMQYMASQNDARALFQGLGGEASAAYSKMQQATVDYILAGNMSGKLAQKPNVNITIQRIEVQSDDPDRYAFGLVEAFRDAVKNPSAAERAIREG
jgi:hypothetical protein